MPFDGIFSCLERLADRSAQRLAAIVESGIPQGDGVAIDSAEIQATEGQLQPFAEGEADASRRGDSGAVRRIGTADMGVSECLATEQQAASDECGEPMSCMRHLDVLWTSVALTCAWSSHGDSHPLDIGMHLQKGHVTSASTVVSPAIMSHPEFRLVAGQ